MRVDEAGALGPIMAQKTADIAGQWTAFVEGVRGAEADWGQASSGHGKPVYAVWDAKFGKRGRPVHMLQLWCYSEMLSELTGDSPVRGRSFYTYSPCFYVALARMLVHCQR